MQWLIDIIAEQVIAEIGIPPVYIDRGDPAAFDFDKNNFTPDSAWHDLDLSSIVPTGAVAIHIRVDINNISSGKKFYLREKGNSNNINTSAFKTYSVMGTRTRSTIVSCNANRVIQYNAESPAQWITLDLAIRGWIL